METTDTVIAVFADRDAAETAIKKLTASGFAMRNLSVVGKGCHTDERSSASIMSVTGSSFGARGGVLGRSLAGCF